MTNKESIQLPGYITIILEDFKTGKKDIKESRNIVTDAGDLFYCQRANQENSDNAFNAGVLVMGTAGNTPGKVSLFNDITTQVPNSLKALEPGYPKRNDTDVSNTGAAVDSITYKYRYSTTQGNYANINRIAITIQNPIGDSPLLMYAVVPTFTKDNTKVLTIFINHNFKGV